MLFLNKMKQLTIFTPTFNRAYTLPILYDSLISQTEKSFIWLIVDDGSADNTEEIVKHWITENKLEIKYVKQQNMGMVAAHNTAHLNIFTELNVCIDSDDFMPLDGVNSVLDYWNSLENKENLMGIVGLDTYKSGEVIGDSFPANVERCTFSEIIHKYKIKGDKKYVLRTDLIKSVLPYPYIEGEKFPAPSYLYLILESKFKFALLNKPLCIVEYLPDGNSMNKVKQYLKSPNAFALYRIARMKYSYDFKDKVKNCLHYISSKILGDRKNMIKDSPEKLLTIVLFPFGFLLSRYIKTKKGGAVNIKLNNKK